MLKSMGAPEHVMLFTETEAVTVTWEVNAVLLLAFVALNVGKPPLPLAPKPIPVFAFDHIKVLPTTGLVKLIAEN
jgi:hypothetical protein